MGTSKSFGKINHPQWGGYSSSVTRNCTGDVIPTSKISNIIRQYVAIIGGSSKASSGRSNISGRSGVKTANKLSKFLAKYISSGYNLDLALKDTGYTDLTNKSVSNIINHLIEYCSGVAVVIDDRAAKEASKILLEEIVDGAATIDELQEKLKTILDQYGLDEIIIKYFGYYIYEHHSVMFHEKLVKQKGEKNCAYLFKQIKIFIIERLKEIHLKSRLDKIKWGGEESEKLIRKIYNNVLEVFE